MRGSVAGGADGGAEVRRRFQGGGFGAWGGFSMGASVGYKSGGRIFPQYGKVFADFPRYGKSFPRYGKVLGFWGAGRVIFTV